AASRGARPPDLPPLAVPPRHRVTLKRLWDVVGMPGALKPYHIDTLKHIALRGGAKDFVSMSSREFGEALGVSQQSASQRILELLNEGLIQRDLATRRQRVRSEERRGGKEWRG